LTPIFFAGTPPTISFSSISFTTAALATIITLSSIFISPITLAPAEIRTPFPIVGVFLSKVYPIVTY